MREKSKSAIREAIAEMRERGFTIVNNNWGLSCAYLEEVGRNTIGLGEEKKCCALGALIIQRFNLTERMDDEEADDETRYSTFLSAAAYLLEETEEEVEDFINGFDGRWTHLPGGVFGRELWKEVENTYG